MIGSLKPCFGAVVRTKFRNADAAGYRAYRVKSSCLNSCTELFSRSFQLCCIFAVDDRSELLTAPASNGSIFAGKRLTDYIRKSDESLIADSVAVGIVDLLEVVEVKYHQTR